jgi:hypothetical protein
MIVGGIAVREVAAHRRQVAHQWIGDHRHGVREQRVLAVNQLGALEVRLTGAATDRQPAAFFLDVLEAGDAADVNQVAGAGQPQLEQRQQALAAGQHLGVVAVPGEQSQRLLQRPRRVIVKGCGNHRWLLSDRTSAGD